MFLEDVERSPHESLGMELACETPIDVNASLKHPC